MSDIIESVLKWQALARPVPDDKGRMVAIGVHIEEISEMFGAMGMQEIEVPMSTLATAFKTGETAAGSLTYDMITINRKELLDALCDQIVTAIGTAHCLGLDIVEAMKRVDSSNWSKFVDGAPLFDANGKVTKGPDYQKPNLDGLY